LGTVLHRRVSTVLGVVLAVHALGLATAAASAVTAPGLTWSRPANNARWVQGHVTIPAPPERVFERLAQVDAWPQLFTDIAAMRVIEHHGPEWKIDLETREGHQGTLHVELGPGRKVTFSASKTGARIAGETLVRGAAAPGQSDVVYNLYVHGSGIPGLFMPERVLRSKQEYMVVAQLSDLYYAFAPRRRQRT
jgi:uncharacterized membrane protein